MKNKQIGFYSTLEKDKKYEAFSNFHQKTFYVPKFNMTFSCVEQYYAYAKAIYFATNTKYGNPNRKIADKIIKCDRPIKMKNYGRKVKGYSDDQWKLVRNVIMFEGLECKFKDSKLMELLQNTEDAELVETNPYDTYWGAGIDVATLEKEGNYPGKNMLGKLLMTLRKVSKSENN